MIQCDELRASVYGLRDHIETMRSTELRLADFSKPCAACGSSSGRLILIDWMLSALSLVLDTTKEIKP